MEYFFLYPCPHRFETGARGTVSSVYDSEISSVVYGSSEDALVWCEEDFFGAHIETTGVLVTAERASRLNEYVLDFNELFVREFFPNLPLLQGSGGNLVLTKPFSTFSSEKFDLWLKASETVILETPSLVYTKAEHGQAITRTGKRALGCARYLHHRHALLFPWNENLLEALMRQARNLDAPQTFRY
jgi:hypothetical protein